MTSAFYPAQDQPTDPQSDPQLICLVRGGDTDAFGLLYERHLESARRLARVLSTDHADADDLIADTFAKVLAVLRNGGGPDTAFRAYLLTTMRHTRYDRARRERRVELTDDLTRYERAEPVDDPTISRLETSYAARAFNRLPERWRAVLWHTEVEGESPSQVAPLLGLTPNGVAALAYRARERLRQMYLQEHIALTGNPRCHWTGSHLAGYVRAALAKRDRSKVDEHLSGCAECRRLHRELTEENAGLRGVVAPCYWEPPRGLPGRRGHARRPADRRLGSARAVVGPGRGEPRHVVGRGGHGGARRRAVAADRARPPDQPVRRREHRRRERRGHRGAGRDRRVRRDDGDPDATHGPVAGGAGAGARRATGVRTRAAVARGAVARSVVTRGPHLSTVAARPHRAAPGDRPAPGSPAGRRAHTAARGPAPVAPAPVAPAPPAEPDAEVSAPELTEVDLVAGRAGTLPIPVRASSDDRADQPENAPGASAEQTGGAADATAARFLSLPASIATEPESVPSASPVAAPPGAVRIDVTLPAGLRLAGTAAGDGWQCEATATGASCDRPRWKKGPARWRGCRCWPIPRSAASRRSASPRRTGSGSARPCSGCRSRRPGCASGTPPGAGSTSRSRAAPCCRAGRARCACSARTTTCWT
ncbi:sigma-70 family RNA polymerase sigma factor [Catellatospora coxensis]